MKNKILIVDDERSNISLLANALKEAYTVLAAKNGEEGLKRAVGPNPPDLILLDIIMPGMDGYEVCEKLKATPETRDIPVIFVTGVNRVQDEAKGFELGAVDYITKPFNMSIVLARIRTQIELRETHRKLIAQNEEMRRAMAEIRRLQGFLPICASCKKIRDDEGYWQRIEKYIQDRSDAVFSHSICPECAAEMYREMEGLKTPPVFGR